MSDGTCFHLPRSPYCISFTDITIKYSRHARITDGRAPFNQSFRFAKSVRYRYVTSTCHRVGVGFASELWALV